MKKNVKEYGMIVLRAVVIFLLYGYVMTFTNEYVAKTLHNLNLPVKTQWMFLLVRLVSMYAGIAVLWKFILQRSAIRKRLLAGVIPADLSYKDSAHATLGFRFFWIEALSILLPCACFLSVRQNVCDMVGLKTDSVLLQYTSAILLFVIPMILVFCHIEVQLRREWAREWYHLDEGKLRRFREGDVQEKKYYVKLAINLVLFLFAMLMLPTVMVYLMAALYAFSAFAEILPQICIIAILGVIFWFVIRVWRGMRRRKKFIRQVQDVCDQHKFKFTYHFTFWSLFAYSKKSEFTVKTPQKTFVGRLLPVPGRSSNVYFSPYEDAYRMIRRILAVFYISFPRHKLDLPAASCKNENTENVIVLTRRPTRWIYGTEKGGSALDNGSILIGKKGKVTLYEIEGFVSAVSMEDKGRRNDLWR